MIEDQIFVPNVQQIFFIFREFEKKELEITSQIVSISNEGLENV